MSNAHMTYDGSSKKMFQIPDQSTKRLNKAESLSSERQELASEREDNQKSVFSSQDPKYAMYNIQNSHRAELN